jgi:hypothetical protein
MNMSKRTIVALVIGGVALAIGVVIFASLHRGRKGGDSTQPTSVENATPTKSNPSNESAIESGDSFNTDDLDTGIAKEGRSTGGLAHGVDETEASTEASEPETYAETDADGKNLTEPAQTIPTVEHGLSASEYGQIAESVQQQNNTVINDTSSDGAIGKDVNDAVSAIQDAELEEAKKAWNDPEFQKAYREFRENGRVSD